MYILGISAFYHDSAACILKDGEILKSEACLLTSKKNVKKKRLNNLIKLLSK